MSSPPLPAGLKNAGGGPRPTTRTELAYASNRFERITRVLMTEGAAMFWAKRIERWSDVMRVIVRAEDGRILYDVTNEHRITSDELRERATWVTDHGSFVTYANWNPGQGGGT